MNTAVNKIFSLKISQLVLKIFQVVIVATFLAVIFSAIDRFIWNNEFSWLTVMVGFSTGALLMFVGTSSASYNK